MNISGGLEYDSFYFENISAIEDFDFQVGSIICDYSRKLLYLIHSQSQGTAIVIAQFDKDFNLLGVLDSSSDFSSDIRSATRYSRFQLNSDGTQILVQAHEQGDGTSYRLGYIDIDFSTFSDSTITLSGIINTVNNTNGSLVFEKIGNVIYTMTEAGQIYKTDISTDFRTDLDSVFCQAKLGWAIDRGNTNQYFLVKRNTTRAYLIEYDYVGESVTNTSSNYLDVGTFDEAQKYGAVQILEYNEKDNLFRISLAQDGNDYAVVGWYDKDLTLVSSLVQFPMYFNTSSSIGYRRNLVIFDGSGNLINVQNRVLLYAFLVQQTDLDAPLISGEIVSDEQDDLSVPFNDTYDEVELRRFDGANVIKRNDTGRISKIIDSARGLSMYQSNHKLQAVYREESNFNSKPSIFFDGYQNGLDYGSTYNKAIYNKFLNLSEYVSDEIWLLFAARLPTVDKKSYFWSDGSSKYLEFDRQLETVSNISGSNDAIFSGVDALGDANLYALKMKVGETSKLYAGGESGLISSDITLTSDNFVDDYIDFMNIADGRLILARLVLIKTTEMTLGEKTAYINDEMQDMATEYDLTWDDII